jgi:hypothetical protein
VLGRLGFESTELHGCAEEKGRSHVLLVLRYEEELLGREHEADPGRVEASPVQL